MTSALVVKTSCLAKYGKPLRHIVEGGNYFCVLRLYPRTFRQFGTYLRAATNYNGYLLAALHAYFFPRPLTYPGTRCAAVQYFTTSSVFY